MTRSIPTLANWTVRGLWASIVIEVLLVGAQLIFAYLLYLEEAGAPIAETVIALRRDGETVLNVLSLLVYVMTSVVFLIWIYRTNERAHSTSSGPLEFSPRWAVAAFVIPLLNLVAPHRVALELWRRGTPYSGSMTIPPQLRWWWPITVLGQLGGYVAFRNYPADDASYGTWYAYTGLSVIVLLLGILASSLSIWLVRRITHRQVPLGRAASGVAEPPASEPAVDGLLPREQGK